MDSSAETTSLPPPIRRATQNFWLNVSSTLVLSAVVGSGILLKWIIPPGIRGGRGLTWLGESRHFWGDMHFWLVVVFLCLVATHIVMHWSWIRSCWQQHLGCLRSFRTWAVLLPALVLITLPLIIPSSRTGQVQGEFRPGRGLGYQERARDAVQESRSDLPPRYGRGGRYRRTFR